MLQTFKSKFAQLSAMLMLALVAPFAMAAGTGPDLSSITDLLAEYGPAVVALVIAFAVVLWSIKAAGLTKPR